MGAQFITILVILASTLPATLPINGAPLVVQKPSEAVLSPLAVTASQAQVACDARPYQRLVGRTVSDLLTARLPNNTRIYRLGDPIPTQSIGGRLSIELNRGTRVARVYCS
jgi:hypothetical protein